MWPLTWLFVHDSAVFHPSEANVCSGTIDPVTQLEELVEKRSKMTPKDFAAEDARCRSCAPRRGVVGRIRKEARMNNSQTKELDVVVISNQVARTREWWQARQPTPRPR